MYSPVLCNGLNIPIVVTLLSDDGQLEKVNLSQKSRSGVLKGGRYVQITVSNTKGELLAQYPRNVLDDKELSGLGSNPFWLVTETGLFLIPGRFKEKWEDQIQEIERTSGFSFSNPLGVCPSNTKTAVF